MGTYRETFRAHFETHEDPNNPDIPACHWCQIAQFTTHSTAYISIINKVDNESLQKDFVFIQNCQPGKGIKLPDPEFFSGCECKRNSNCKTSKCNCLQDMINPDAHVYETIDGENFMSHQYLNTRDPIYECHQACSCDTACPNRVVEHGRTVPLQIFRTDDGRGWGVRSPQDIRKGQFVDRYVGELITAEETERRRQRSDIAAKKDVYLFELDKFKDDADRDPTLAETVFVDGEYASGPSRFINHSCDPNLRIFARVGDHATKRFHDLAFFAVRDIPADTELTFDYVDGEDEKLEEEKKNPNQKKEMTKCLCRSRKCRGYLW